MLIFVQDTTRGEVVHATSLVKGNAVEHIRGQMPETFLHIVA